MNLNGANSLLNDELFAVPMLGFFARMRVCRPVDERLQIRASAEKRGRDFKSLLNNLSPHKFTSFRKSLQ